MLRQLRHTGAQHGRTLDVGCEAAQKLALLVTGQRGICGAEVTHKLAALCVGTDAQRQGVARAVGDQQVGVDRGARHHPFVEVIVVCPAAPGGLLQGNRHAGVVVHVMGFVLMHCGCGQLKRGYSLQHRHILAIQRHVLEPHTPKGLRHGVERVVPVTRIGHPVVQQGHDWINV